MDAVTASTNVDYSQSVAYDDDEFGVDFEPIDAHIVNGLLHADGTITPEMVDEVGYDDVLNDYELEALKSEIDGSLLDKLDDIEIEGFNGDDFAELSSECELTEEELEILLKVQTAYLASGDVKEVQKIMEDELEHLAIAKVKVVAGAAVAVVAVVSVVNAVHTTV